MPSFGDSPRSPRPRGLLGLPIGFETERVCLGVYNNEGLTRRFLRLAADYKALAKGLSVG